MSETGWRLHEQLKADTHSIGRLDASHLLLHRNAALHWFILVPETDVMDLLDLPVAQREALLRDGAQVAAYLKDSLGYPRVNVGALGLVVPQLHLHVVGRREDDPCWPAPVWGNLTTGPEYSSAALHELRAELAGA